MILGLLYSIVRFLLDLLVLRQKTEAALEIEVFSPSATSSASSNARSIGPASNQPTVCF